ncbi:MAG: hypothetical protein ACK5PF_10740 [bacterium]|jgi:hypothetical protein
MRGIRSSCLVRVLRLTPIALEVVEAILDGNEKQGVTLVKA